MAKLSSGSQHITIARPVADVWAAITDITRMGEWSPECRAGRWMNGASGPAVGAEFEGDNEYRVAGKVVSKWTTTSVITECVPTSRFVFIASKYTTWTYELEVAGSGARLTESFTYTPRSFVHLAEDKLFRHRVLVNGLANTLTRLKQTLESSLAGGPQFPKKHDAG